MPFRVLQLTDLHVFSKPNTTLKGIPTRESLSDVVDHILKNEAPFDAVIITGDHTHDELPESYEAVRNILAPWHDRLWQIPGNHDDRQVLREVFGDRIAGQHGDVVNFCLEAEQWGLIGLDSHWPGEVAGRFDQAQAVWLKRQLSEQSCQKIALFIHHPPIDIGSEWMDAIGLHGRELLHDIVESDGRIALICCGHVHHEFQGALGQAIVQATPSTGIQFDPAGSIPHFVPAAPGYRVLGFDADRFTSRVVRLPEVKYVPADD